MTNSGPLINAAQMRAHIDAMAANKAAFTRMVRNADFRIAAMGEAARGRTGDDLLNEAILACLEGRRNCPVGVPFDQFLRGVIRSIASHWCEEHDTSMATPDSHTVDEATGESAIDRTGVEPNMEDHLDSERLKERIKGMFPGDRIISAIFEGLAEGLDGPRIQSDNSITRNEYEYGLERIRKRKDWIRR